MTRPNCSQRTLTIDRPAAPCTITTQKWAALTRRLDKSARSCDCLGRSWNAKSGETCPVIPIRLRRHSITPLVGMSFSLPHQRLTSKYVGPVGIHSYLFTYLLLRHRPTKIRPHLTTSLPAQSPTSRLKFLRRKTYHRVPPDLTAMRFLARSSQRLAQMVLLTLTTVLKTR